MLRPTRSTSSRSGVRSRQRRQTLNRACIEALEGRRLLSFTAAASNPVDVNPQAVATADLNGDGRLDLVTANADANSISVLLGNGDGTFQPARTFAAGAYPRSVAVGDFDRDGKPDLIIADGGSAYLNGGGGLTLLRGNGDGTFQPAQTLFLPNVAIPGAPQPAPQTPLAVAVGDINNDGKLDLVVSARANESVLTGTGYYGNYYQAYEAGYVNVLIGAGDGTFTQASASQSGKGLPLDLGLADFNGDHKLDVVTGQNVTVMLGNGDGTLRPPASVNSNGAAAYTFGDSTVPIGDFNNDGIPDLLLRDISGTQLLIMKGNGDGTFQNIGTINPGVTAGHAAVTGDVNADGKLDIVIATSVTQFASYGGSGNYYYGFDPTTTEYATVLLGNSDGSFATPITSTLDSRPGYTAPSAAVLGDFNGDHRPDLAVSLVAVDTFSAGSVIVAPNDGNWVAVQPPPLVSIGDATVTEGDSGSVNAVFTVTLSKASTKPVTVQYATAGGTATSGQDFTAVAGTLTFAPGETSKAISVAVIGDLIDEYDETFSVNLSAPVNAQIGDGVGIGTIIDNDPPPTMVINDVTKAEGNSGYTSFIFTVSLSAPSEKNISVNYSTADGTATTGDKDYLATSGTLFFAAGQMSQTITVKVIGDTRKEADENFFVNLSAPTNAVLVDSQGIGTILNDDTSPGNGGKHVTKK